MRANKTWNTIILGAAAILLAAGGIACAGERFVLKIAYGEPPDINTSLEHVMGTNFKEILERESGGEIRVQLFPGGTLGDGETTLQQVHLGSLEACPIADGKLSGLFEPIQILSIPYLFDNREEAFKVLDGSTGKKLVAGLLEKTGLRIVTIGENGGFRSFTNNTRVIRTPADMKGLKFRVMQSPIFLNMVESLGGIPAAIAFGELYTAIQTNVIQGQENPPPVVRAQSLYEIQPYYTLDRHTYSVNFMVINERWYQGLPDNLKEAVLRTGKQVETIHRDTSARWETEAVVELRKLGMDIYEPTPEEMLQFRTLTQDKAIAFLKKSIDASWVDDIVAEVEKVRAEMGKK